MATKTRGKGEGSVFQDARGLWTGVIELPPRDGVRRRKKIRRKSKPELLKAMDDLRQELRERGDIQTVDMTVEQWFTYWYTQIVVKEVRPKTAAGYKTIVFNHVIPVIGKKKLSRLNAASIREVTDKVLGYSEKTGRMGSSTYANQVHKVMSTAFKAAIRERRIQHNPCDELRAPRKAVAALEVLTAAESLHVYTALLNKKDPDMRAYGARYAVAMLTGARRGELLGLESDRISVITNPANGQTQEVLDLSWQLQRFSGPDARVGNPNVPADYEYRHLYGGYYLTRPKSRAGTRVIPLVEPLKTIITEHLADNPVGRYGLVFARNGKPADPDWDSKNWKTVLASLGITKNIRLHDLRHGAVDMFYRAGVPEDVISALVGHSTITMTRGYQSRDIQRLQDGMALTAGRFTQPAVNADTTPGAA